MIALLVSRLIERGGLDPTDARLVMMAGADVQKHEGLTPAAMRDWAMGQIDEMPKPSKD